MQNCKEYIISVYDKNGDINKVLDFLQRVEQDFIPKFSSVVNLKEFSRKICFNAILIVAENDKKILGLAAFYLNQKPEFSYWTFFAVDEHYRAYPIAIEIERKVIDYCFNKGSAGIEAEVREKNSRVLKLHKVFGFSEEDKYYSLERNEFRVKIKKVFNE